MFFNIWQWFQVEIEVLGNFIEFGWFGWPDFAYCDSWQRYVATNGGQGADKSILGPRFRSFWSNFGPKMSKIKFLTILSNLVDSIGLILRIMIASNDI